MKNLKMKLSSWYCRINPATGFVAWLLVFLLVIVMAMTLGSCASQKPCNPYDSKMKQAKKGYLHKDQIKWIKEALN